MIPLLSLARTMLAKLKVSDVQENHLGAEKSSESLTMFPVSDREYDAEGNSDDNTFSKWTPSGSLTLTVTNPNLFDKVKIGGKYYVSFHKELTEADLEGPLAVAEDKALRLAIDDVIQQLRSTERKSRERSLALTKLQEAVMWLGMDLKDLKDNPAVYAASYDPSSPVIEPTSDGVKL